MTSFTHTYDGDLRVTAQHTGNHTTLQTDAPQDNNGKGELFSPTDLLATSWMNCILTVLGIAMDQGNLPKRDMSGTVTKVMGDHPRVIRQLKGELTILGGANLDAATREKLKHIALNCPVAKSLSDDLDQHLTITYAG
jgi:uncharacterized OsmC-like protein